MRADARHLSTVRTRKGRPMGERARESRDWRLWLDSGVAPEDKEGAVYFVLTDKSTGLSFPFTNDKPGHFRTPDVGAGIKEIGEQVDVKEFTLTVNVAGYKRATITRMPRKAQGTVELDVRLDPVSGEVSAAGLSGTDTPPYTKTAIAVIGSLLLFVIVRVARTSTRPRTTTR